MIQTKLKINANKECSHIAPEIYGQFSEHLGRCIYEGIYVGEDSDIPNKNGIRTDVVEALKELKVPVLRWPGGCFADEYHWKDGIGPEENRRHMVNSNWGGVVEDNSFGTHEFMDLCEQIGCEPYLAVNMGSGTVAEAADWVEYLTADGESDMAKLRAKNGHKEPWKIKYLGIGNESWGCGGNMSADYYANEYKKYQTFCREYGDNHLYKIACGPSADDYEWTKELLKRVNGCHTRGISLHYYTLPTGDWGHKGSATEFDEKEYYQTIQQTMRMDEVIKGHLAVMDKYDPDHKISLIVDEWGTWYDVEPGMNPGFLYQQNTMRDAIVAAYNLNLFNKHSDRIAMANIAQAVNVLQAMILTQADQLVKTPTYEVFWMYRDHQDATLVESHMLPGMTGTEEVWVPALSESCSIQEKNGEKILTITLSNASLKDPAQIAIELEEGMQFAGEASITELTGEVHAHNTFEQPDCIMHQDKIEQWSGKTKTIEVGPCSVYKVSVHVKA